LSPVQQLIQIFGDSQNKQQGNDMTRECSRRILNRGNGNASVLADYLMAYKRDNPCIAHSSLATNLLNLVRFAEKVIKPFVDMERDDVLGYLDGLEKPKSLDPTRERVL
jgi:hypothetical protein